MLLTACGLSSLLAYLKCGDSVIAASLVLPAFVLGITTMVVREAIKSKQLILLAPEKVIMEAFRHNLVGSREHVLAEAAPPKALEEARQELAQVQLDPHHHRGDGEALMTDHHHLLVLVGNMGPAQRTALATAGDVDREDTGE